MCQGEQVMDRKSFVYGVAFSLLGMCAYAPAYAAGSLTADFFTLSPSNPDVEHDIPGVTTGLVESTLGPNGLPVLNPSDHSTYSIGSSNYISNINPVTGEILWWTPSSTVTADAQNVVVTLPYDQVLYPNGTGIPNSIDGDGSDGYTSAHLSGTFDLASPGTITMSLGSDDDAWVFVNGNLVDDNGGVHGFSDVPFAVTTGLDVGVNTVDIFFADRHTVGSELAFDADVTITPTTAVPEPSSLEMLLAGLGLIGGLLCFGRKKVMAA
jgi:fibro-slime domain-containing protein